MNGKPSGLNLWLTSLRDIDLGFCFLGIAAQALQLSVEKLDVPCEAFHSMKAALPFAGLAPEMVWFHPTDDMQAGTVGNQLRPEVLESLFYMWRFTGDIR